MRPTLCAAVATALILTSTVTAASAAVDAPAEDVAAAIAAVAPDAAPLVTPESVDPAQLEVSTDAADVTIPADGLGDVVVTGTDAGAPAVGIALPAEVEVDEALVADDGTVVFEGAASVDAAVQVMEDGSVRMQTVLHDASAPREFSYDLSLPEGSTARLLDGGSVLVTDEAGAFVAGVAAPWAADATGRALATHYRLEGSTLVQVVDVDDDAVYPVVADPWLGIALIKSVVKTSSTQGTIYKVTPTAYGRVATELALWATWTESVSKGVPNRQNLQEQLICHPMSYVARVKSTWNLDTWRPTVGLAKTIAASCNP
ncbi:DUF2599 domain-containing protein [Cellulomonas phragmiteti]|uniref:DUF2599 domain-containing protein n=1 Tax=Cellulomonas phragmiteti TaxID=478780 RepID=A0ABQ4DQX0_9CELL|nr:DUF2599 domain-containing protein [Cellulomonas phragmiteti]GIG41719.1 hypothetical protein Cph01nite_34810 [Cellulomonas phragmiteti]